MKVSKVRERRAVLTDTLELRFCRVCGAYPRFSTIAAVTQPDLRAASIYNIYDGPILQLHCEALIFVKLLYWTWVGLQFRASF